MAEVSPVNKMQYVRLGNSGLKVSRIILGTMQYGHKGWQSWVIDDEEEVLRHIKFAYDSGIQTFDTANVYSNGRSEEMLGSAIKKLNLPREELVIMTKVYSPVSPGENVYISPIGKMAEDLGIINQMGLNRKHIFESVKASLRRLQLDYIDVLQCHRFDYTTPIEETMQALHDVVKAGYVRYVGMSSCFAYQFHAMQTECLFLLQTTRSDTQAQLDYAINNKLTPFISMQDHYNMLYREEEREMFPTLKMFGVGAIPWSPLARGILTRPSSETSSTARAQADVKHTWALVRPRVEEIAKKKGITMAHVSVAWTLSKEHITAPIVGTTKLDNLQEILEAVHIKLTDEEIKYLDEPYQPTSVWGHW